MKNFIKKHPIIVLVAVGTVCETTYRCMKLYYKNKNKSLKKDKKD